MQERIWGRDYACTGETVFAVLHRRKALQLLENKAFPCCIQILSQSIVRLVGEFVVTDSVCRRPKSGSPGCESQWLRRIPYRLSLKPSTGPSLSRYPNFCHWLKLQVSTPDSEKVVLWERFWHWQVFYGLTESLSAIEFIARDVPYLLRLRVWNNKTQALSSTHTSHSHDSTLSAETVWWLLD